MAVIITPGAGVNDLVAVLLSEVARPGPTPDEVRVPRLLRLAVAAAVTGTRKSFNRDGVEINERHRDDDDDDDFVEDVHSGCVLARCTSD